MSRAGSPQGNGAERSQGFVLCARVIGSPSGHDLQSAGFNASGWWWWWVGEGWVQGGLTLAADFSEASIRVVRVLLKHTATSRRHSL